MASFFPDGRPKYVEVKTTTGPKNSSFYISPNEIAFSAQNIGSFELCRVFSYNKKINSARSYSIIGDLRTSLHIVEAQYLAKPLHGARNAPET
ncbi:MAG: DUF3883 domain-containing protein [Hyphomicrobiales bacterium]